MMKLALEKKWLLNPWTLITATLMGILGGYFFNNQATYIEPIGVVFLNAISMCILPLIFFSMLSSFAKAVKNQTEAAFLLKFLRIAFIAILLTALLGVLTALSSNFFGVITAESKAFIGNILVMDAQVPLIPTHTAADVAEVHGPFNNFVNTLVVANILKNVVEGNYLPLLLFSCLLGMSLGFVKGETQATIKSIDHLYYAVVKIIAGLMYFLPFALIAIFSNFVAKYGFVVIYSVTKMLLLLFIVCISLFSMQIYLMARAYKQSFLHMLNAVKQPVLIGFMTSSSLAAFPSLTHVLEKEFRVPHDLIELATPLSLFLNQQGTTLIVTFITVLLAGLFKIPLSIELVAVLIFAAVLFSIASSGAPFIAVIALFAIPLAPIGIPLDSVFVFLIIIFLIADPVVTALNVNSTLTVISWINRSR